MDSSPPPARTAAPGNPGPSGKLACIMDAPLSQSMDSVNTVATGEDEVSVRKKKKQKKNTVVPSLEGAPQRAAHRVQWPKGWKPPCLTHSFSLFPSLPPSLLSSLPPSLSLSFSFFLFLFYMPSFNDSLSRNHLLCSFLFQLY